MANILSTVSNACKATATAAAGVVGFEVGTAGARMAVSDAKFVGRGVKELKNPTPIKVKKKGLFAKKEVITVNPFTGKISPYKGSKKPVNKKAIVIK